MTEMDRKEVDMKQIIETLRGSKDKAMVEIAILSFAQGLETGLNLANGKRPGSLDLAGWGGR